MTRAELAAWVLALRVPTCSALLMSADLWIELVAWVLALIASLVVTCVEEETGLASEGDPK